MNPDPDSTASLSSSPTSAKGLKPNERPARAWALRVAAVSALGVCLCLPLLSIWLVIVDRAARAEAADLEVRKVWGRDTVVVGPLLVIPGRALVSRDELTGVADQRRLTANSRWIETRRVITPAQLAAEAALTPQLRARGLFQVPVFTSEMTLEAAFELPLPTETDRSATTELRLQDAYLVFFVKELKGVDRVIAWEGKEGPGSSFRLDSDSSSLGAELRAQCPLEASERSLSVKIRFPSQGSGAFSYVPTGQASSFTLASPWPDPSFFGASLPAIREVSDHGFTATWRFSPYELPLPPSYTVDAQQPLFDHAKLLARAVGSRLELAVGPQRMAERAIKYSALLVFLLLGALLGLEARGDLALNLAHYLLIGLALCLFFLALLAVHEVLPFAPAYFITAGLAWAMIVAFTRHRVTPTGRSGVLAAALAGLFGWLYVVLSLEDYALLAGTAALFVALGAAMGGVRSIHRRPPGFSIAPQPTEAPR